MRVIRIGRLGKGGQGTADEFRFNDRVQDALVWHDGVRIEGEKVSGGVQRILSRIAEAGLEDDEGDAWEGMGGIYRGVGSH